MSEALELAINIAQQAGALLLGYFRSDQLQTIVKEDRSLVTQADLEADRFVTNQIRQNFPADSFLSEELSPDFRGCAAGESGATWIIDPLDGTTNFSLGLPIWGISVARIVNGLPDCATLYFPALNELYAAEAGNGATFNDQPLKIKPERYRMMSFFTCCSRAYQRYNIDIPFKTRILGSAAYNFCCVARGIAAIGFEATPKIWDIAAAWLIVKEAGGGIQTLDGNAPFPIRQGVDYLHQSFPTIAAITRERLVWGLDRIHLK
jgi:myo-inositol-1(or 4)-monophosphatase